MPPAASSTSDMYHTQLRAMQISGKGCRMSEATTGELGARKTRATKDWEREQALTAGGALLHVVRPICVVLSPQLAADLRRAEAADLAVRHLGVGGDVAAAALRDADVRVEHRLRQADHGRVADVLLEQGLEDDVVARLHRAARAGALAVGLGQRGQCPFHAVADLVAHGGDGVPRDDVVDHAKLWRQHE